MAHGQVFTSLPGRVEETQLPTHRVNFGMSFLGFYVQERTMFVDLDLRLSGLRFQTDGTFFHVEAGQGFADCFLDRRPAHGDAVWAFRREPGSIEFAAGRWVFTLDWGRVSPQEPHEATAGA